MDRKSLVEKGKQSAHDLDSCYCGDFCRSHKNGTGRCAACECHSGPICLKFRLSYDATEYRRRYPEHYAQLTGGR